jgi:DNA adenine methylase
MEQIAIPKLIEPILNRIKIKSPLRYPGGKSKALKQILPIIPYFEEMREPMVGGGSVFLSLKQLFPNKRFWINDLNKDLYFFWKYSKEEVKRLTTNIQKIKSNTEHGHQLFLELTNSDKDFNEFERAVRFFILNRITFSGTADSGGFSKQAFAKRFTNSSIERVKEMQQLLDSTRITNEDYEKMLHAPGEEVFIFLDPPYLSKTKSKLYGKKGELHISFDHERFAKNMKKCNHKWLITYDNSPEVIKLFSFANIYEWELQYGMNNYKQESAAIGKELFISNYEISSLEKRKIN